MTGVLNNFPEQLCKDPKFNGRNMTNRVLYSDSSTTSLLLGNKNEFLNKQIQRKKITYYCPVYMRVKIKNFSELNHEDLQAAVNMNIILTINFRGISPLIQNKIKSLLRLSFNRDTSLIVQKASSTIKPQRNGMYTFIIQKCVHVAIKPHVFKSPFQILYLIMSIQIQDIQMSLDIINEIIEQGQLVIKKLNKQLKQQLDINQSKYSLELIKKIEKQMDQLKNIGLIYVRFNMMDCLNKQLKIQFTSQGTFGNYDLAQALLQVQFTNQSVCGKVINSYLEQGDSQQQKNKLKGVDYSLVKPYKFAHYQIPLYKFPMVTLSTIFIPLWLLSIITIGIYFQQATLVDRVQSVSSLLIAFVQLISVIRDQIPPSPKVSLLEYLVYIELVSTCILILIHSINIYLTQQNYQFQWWTNGFFYVSSAVTIIQFIIIMLLVIIHKTRWQPSYNREPNQNPVKFNYQKWQKAECDQHFKRKIDRGLISVIKVYQQQQIIKNYLPSISQDQIQDLKNQDEPNNQKPN